VSVIHLGTRLSTGENFRWILEHLRPPATGREVLATCLGSPTTILAVAATSLGAPQISVAKFRKNLVFWTLLVRLEIIATTYRSMIVKTHVFRLYSHLGINVSMYLCIYTATYLHMVYLERLQVVIGSNSRCAWKWWSSELGDALGDGNGAYLEIHLVLATGPDSWVGSGSGSTQDRTVAMGLTTQKTRTFANGPVLPPKTRHFMVTILAPIKNLSSYWIMTWSVHTSCSCSRSFTSRCQISDWTNIRWVAIENPRILLIIPCSLTAIQWILVRSQIWKRWVDEQLQLHYLHTDHFMIHSDLRY